VSIAVSGPTSANGNRLLHPLRPRLAGTLALQWKSLDSLNVVFWRRSSAPARRAAATGVKTERTHLGSGLTRWSGLPGANWRSAWRQI